MKFIQTNVICRASAFILSKSGPIYPFLQTLQRIRVISLALIAEFFIGYAPEPLLRLALHLPIAPLAALLSFKTVTEQLVDKKAEELAKGDDEKPDLLNAICTLQFKLRVLFFSEERDKSQVGLGLAKGDSPTVKSCFKYRFFCSEGRIPVWVLLDSAYIALALTQLRLLFFLLPFTGYPRIPSSKRICGKRFCRRKLTPRMMNWNMTTCHC
jgi:hypothetical protein